ncbi:MED23 polymerase, partial [Polypterus senegalus]
MMGEKTGVAGRLKQRIPHIITIHCVAHKLELAVLDSVKGCEYLVKFEGTLKTIFKMYYYSPKKRRELTEISELLNEKLAHFSGLKSTRWLPSRLRCLKAVEKNYTPTVVHMENMAGGSDVKSEDAAKAKGVVQEMKTEKFVCFLHFMLDYSTILSKCCTDFQHDNLNITRTNQLVESTTSRLLSLKTKPGEYQKTLDTKFTANEDGSICYCGTQLTKSQRPARRGEGTDKDTFGAEIQKIIDNSVKCSLLPVVNNSGAICNSWKLDPTTLRFPLRGLLPFDKDLFEPQTGLLRYVLEQPYSRDMVCNMLGLNKQIIGRLCVIIALQHKQRCPVLEDQLVDLVVYAMERSETEEQFDDGGTSQLLWQHLSSQLIFFVLFQFASFPHMVLSLHQKCIPVPDINKPQSTHAFAMTCIWIHLNRKAQNDNSKLQIPIPHSLKLHHDLIHSIATRVIKLAHAKSSIALAPALVETYSRLLVYMEIESLGIKGFISQLLPNVFKSHAWGILHTLLEMFSYRMHHIQPHYRVQLLSHLHSLAAVPQTNQNQLHLCVESTALRLITALGSSEVQPQFTRFLSDPKTVLSAESEELNRALILTFARATHVTDFFTGSESIQGTWCKDILQTIMSFTPHNWASHTLSCFPAPLQAFFRQNNVPQESRFNLKKNVEEEYRKWKSMTNENDIITHFSMQGSPPLFLCLLWKMLLETDHINQIGYRVLERIGARSLVAHVRTFADFLVYEFSTSAGGQQLNKCIEILNDMVWKYNIVTLDRLILCLAMRSHEGNEAQVCYFIIQLLLLKPNDFRNRVSDFVKENSPEHWLQSDWHTKHMNYHKKYPEKLYFEGLAEQVNPPVQIQPQYLPIYFGNVCLRFLPVFDIVIHRFLELLPVSKSLETLLDHLGGLYKFHDRPVTYLFNTLHYYERHLRERTNLKRKLVHAIISSLKDNRPQGWCLSETYLKYAMNAREDNPWIPDDTYYCKLIGRLVENILSLINKQKLS